MKRISNVNSFSAIIDRLIIENLKIFQFIEKNEEEKIHSQNEIISELKHELDVIVNEIKHEEYISVGEQRTFGLSDNIFSNLFVLCLNNYSISVGDMLKLKESNKSEVNIVNLKKYILHVRENLESRSQSKNNLEKI